MKKRKTVVVFFGGRSVEHEISILSARSVISNIDRSLFSPLAVFVDRRGVWRKADPGAFARSGILPDVKSPVLVPAPAEAVLCAIKNRTVFSKRRIDVAFPLIHGTDGEDGTIQGLFEMCGIPYVGARVLGSAVSNDKLVAKRLMKNAGLPVAPFCGLEKTVWRQKGAASVYAAVKEVGIPCFVKPSNLGSSVGIFQIEKRSAAPAAVEKSFDFSDTVVFESMVPNTREIEVSVLGLERPRASVPGEIVPSGRFYDYRSKYEDSGSRLIVPAKMPARLKKRICSAALKTFSVLRSAGMARVDFLVNSETGEFFVSELNTVPGFTSISMYPKLWEASGVSQSDLITRLIDFAFQSSEQKNGLKITFP